MPDGGTTNQFRLLAPRQRNPLVLTNRILEPALDIIVRQCGSTVPHREAITPLSERIEIKFYPNVPLSERIAPRAKAHTPLR